MDEREAMTMSSTSQYYIQYRGTGRSDSVLQAGFHETPPIIHSVPTPTASPSVRCCDDGGGGGSIVSAVSPQGSGAVEDAAGMGPVQPAKKKRGRPRKYGPDESMALVLSPQATPGSGPSSGQLQKRGRGRPPGTGTKQQLASFGEWFASSAGMGFTPHIITIATGEDIATKIMSFSMQGPRAVCILSANGVVSTVTLRQPTTSSGTVTYEGRFEILCMSGSYLLADDNGARSRSGGLSISLCSPDGRVIGGGVGGLLVAASPVQVIVGSFIFSCLKAKNKMRSVQEHNETEPASDAKESTPTSTIPSQGLTPPSTGGWKGSSQMETNNSRSGVDLTRE